MEAKPRRIELFTDDKGKQPFVDWLLGLKDKEGKAAVQDRLDRVEKGNLGDCERYGVITELRIHVGPGYRVYVGEAGPVLVILLGGERQGKAGERVQGSQSPVEGTPKEEAVKKPMSYQELRGEVLSDFETALHYLQHALKDNDLAHFMAAFTNVVEAQGGVGKFAGKTRLSRQSIYNAIKNKSLRADSLFEIVRGLGLRFDLVEVKPQRRHKIARSRHVRALQVA